MERCPTLCEPEKHGKSSAIESWRALRGDQKRQGPELTGPATASQIGGLVRLWRRQSVSLAWLRPGTCGNRI